MQSANFDILYGGETGKLLRETDWSKTWLGPIANWPSELKMALNIGMNSRFPMAIWWGEDYTMLYNDAFAEQVQGPLRHPKYFGKPGRDSWEGIWPLIGPVLTSVRETGTATWREDHYLPAATCDDIIEERYFTYSYSPIFINGKVEGIYTTVTETTNRVLGERQVHTLKDLAARSAEAKTTAEACNIVLQGLETNPTDIPFACLYLANGTNLQLCASTGIKPELLSSESIALDRNSLQASKIDQAILKAFTSGQRMLFDVTEYNLPPCGFWNQTPKHCKLLPIASPGQSTPIGVLVSGINQQRRLDEFYSTFFRLISIQVATTLANAHAHEEERRKVEQLAELDRATAFFHNISHEFRTPLSLMIGPLEELLYHGSLSKKDTEQLTRVYRNSLRLLKLVNALLDFSRIEAGKLQGKFQKINLAEFITDVSSSFRSACEKSGLKLTVKCQELPQPVCVDADMFEKTLLNLLSNAYKFTLKGGITVKLRDRGDHAELSVADTGCGIPDSELPHLFDRFHRVASSYGRSNEGTGIGLALVNELVKFHDGSIEVKSKPAVGTKFIISIPYNNEKCASKTDECTVNTNKYNRSAMWLLPEVIEEDTHPSVPEAEAYSPSDYSVLLADDNADMRQYVSQLLRNYYNVQVASNGQEALEKALKNPPNLIISDIMMPVMDGPALLKAIRANEQTKNIPVIFLSARAGEEAKVEGLQLGADDYVVKPFTSKELMARVKAHILLSEERLKSARQAKEANEAKDHFLAILSHELRTPLTPALLLAESIHNNKEFPHSVREDAGQIAYNIKLEVQLIDDLLDITRIAKGKLRLNIQPVNIVGLVSSTAKIVEYDLKEKGLQLQMNLSSVARDSAQGDPSRLQQVFWNILKNAIKFTDKGGRIVINVYNASNHSADLIKIEIEDTGKGISPQLQPKLFHSFEQGSSDITQKFGGLGLGLAITKAIVDMHNGTIEVHSDGDGKGAKFTVSLPVLKDISVENDKQQAKAPERQVPSLDILVVEDNKSTLFVMKKLLSRLGHKITPAASKKEALEVALSRRFELLISDIGLPDGSGLELMQEIRKSYPLKGIALSGYGMEEDITKSLAAGFSLHLIKPIELQQLAEGIAIVMA